MLIIYYFIHLFSFLNKKAQGWKVSVHHKIIFKNHIRAKQKKKQHFDMVTHLISLLMFIMFTEN